MPTPWHLCQEWNGLTHATDELRRRRNSAQELLGEAGVDGCGVAVLISERDTFRADRAVRTYHLHRLRQLVDSDSSRVGMIGEEVRERAQVAAVLAQTLPMFSPALPAVQTIQDLLELRAKPPDNCL